MNLSYCMYCGWLISILDGAYNTLIDFNEVDIRINQPEKGRGEYHFDGSQFLTSTLLKLITVLLYDQTQRTTQFEFVKMKRLKLLCDNSEKNNT